MFFADAYHLTDKCQSDLESGAPSIDPKSFASGVYEAISAQHGKKYQRDKQCENVSTVNSLIRSKKDVRLARFFKITSNPPCENVYCLKRSDGA